MRTLVSMLALTVGLAACANMPAEGVRSAATAPAPSSDIAVAAVDPIDAPPPVAAPAPAAAADPMLLVPAQNQASQRVPLGTLNASSEPKPAATPPTRITSRDSVPQPVRPPAIAAKSPPPAPPVAVTLTPAPAPPPAAPAAVAAAAPPAPREAPAVIPPPAQTAAAAEPALVTPPPATAPSRARTGLLEFNDEETTVISSVTAPPAVQGREFIPAPVVPVVAPPGPPALGEMPFSQAEKNIARRFETLARLRDEGLITQEEFNRRRAANLGALLPYSQNPPGVGLDRSVPSSDAIVARLGALRRSFEMRAITAQQHALERTMILNALLPENPEQRTNRKPPPEDVIQGAAMVGHLEALREESVITQTELDAERRMIDAVLRTGLFPPKGSEATAPQAQAKPAAKPAAPGAAAPAAAAADNPLNTPITGPVLHLASFRSVASATKGWQEVLERNKAALSSYKPIIRRVDLGEGKGVFYRLMTGSFPSLSEAEATCVKLKQNNQFCRASVDGT